MEFTALTDELKRIAETASFGYGKPPFNGSFTTRSFEIGAGKVLQLTLTNMRQCNAKTGMGSVRGAQAPSPPCPRGSNGHGKQNTMDKLALDTIGYSKWNVEPLQYSLHDFPNTSHLKNKRIILNKQTFSLFSFIYSNSPFVVWRCSGKITSMLWWSHNKNVKFCTKTKYGLQKYLKIESQVNIYGQLYHGYMMFTVKSYLT